MNPLLIDKSIQADGTIRIQHHKCKNYVRAWHYHPELELAVQVESRGTRYIGNDVSRFSSGEVILIGKNLPHMWIMDKEYAHKQEERTATAYVIHFKENFAGEHFLDLPIMKAIRELFVTARKGVLFDTNTQEVISTIHEMQNQSDFDRILSFIKLLQMLATESGHRTLSVGEYPENCVHQSSGMLEAVYRFVSANFRQNISVKQVAHMANMHPSSFSRFFSRINNKSFSRYVNEVRISHACRLLIEEDFHVARVCYESGFNNLSNFNRQFRLITGDSPSQYKQRLGQATTMQ